MQLKMTRSSRNAAAAAAVAAAMLLTACSGGGSADDDAAETPGATETHTLKIADFPNLQLASLFAGRDAGVFENHGVELDAIQISGAGAAMIPAAVEGTIDIAPSNVLSVMVAQQNGQDVQCFALITRNPAEGRPLAVLVPGDSTIKSAADLEGKQVAVNALGGANDLIMRAWLDSEGVNPDSVTLVPTDFPNMSQVLANHNVDAALTDEPFTTQAIAEGAKVIEERPYQVIAETPAFSCWVATTKVIAEKADALAAFVAAMNEANENANNDRSVITKTLVDTMGYAQDVAEAATVPYYDANISVDDLAVWAEFAKKYGMLNADFDPATAVSPIAGK